MNELTKRLFAEGWTEDHHPGHVFWAFYQGFRYKWEYARELTWKTPCGLFVSGWTVGFSDTSYGGVDMDVFNGTEEDFRAWIETYQ